MSNPSDHRRGPKANLRLETAAGRLAFARSDMQAGVPGATERYQLYLEEFERLRTKPILPPENTPE